MARTRRRTRRSSGSFEKKKPAVSPDVAPENQKMLINRAIDAMRAFAARTNLIGIQGLREAFWKLQLRGGYPRKIGNTPLTIEVQSKNRPKCRYTDILCLDQTRVILKPWPEASDKSDFIHANWVTGPMLCNKFICTQGPLDNTIPDFWRMVWQERVELVIMLCRTVEAKHKKCAQYWPVTLGQSITYVGITITSEEILKNDPDIVSTTLSLTYGNEKRRVYHHQWVTWPDRFVPKQLVAPFSLLSMARMQKNPVIVHCSAGIGRTGTLVALEILAQTLLAGREPSVPEIIWAIRAQRPKAVQGDEQYLYIHYLVLQRLINKGIIPETAAKDFCRSYESFYYSRTHEVQVPLPVYARRPISMAPVITVGASQAVSVPLPVQTASAASETQKAASAPQTTAAVTAQKEGQTKPGINKKEAVEKTRPDQGGGAGAAAVVLKPAAPSVSAEKQTAKKAEGQKVAASAQAAEVAVPEVALAPAISPAKSDDIDDMEYVFMQPEYAGAYPRYSKDVVAQANRETYAFGMDVGFEKALADECSVYVRGPMLQSKDQALADEQYVMDKKY